MAAQRPGLTQALGLTGRIMVFHRIVLSICMLCCSLTCNGETKSDAAASEFSRLAVAGVNFAIEQKYPTKIQCLAFQDQDFLQEARSALSRNLTPAQLAITDEFFSSSLGRKWTDSTIISRTTGKSVAFSPQEQVRILGVVNLPSYIRAQEEFDRDLKSSGSVKFSVRQKSCE